MVLESSPECSNIPKGNELNAGSNNFLSKLSNDCCPVDPNIIFFCQIVALAVPISVLYGGLYFVSSSASIIAVVCGSIVLTILCIIIVTKPFSGSQDVEESATVSHSRGLISSAVQNNELHEIDASQKSILRSPLQKIFPQSKRKKSCYKKTKRLRTCSRGSSKGRTTSSECSFLSDAEEGKCLLGPPHISSESEDDGMDLLNINEKVLRRDDYFGPPSLRNAESKRNITIEKTNYDFAKMVKDRGLKALSPGDSGLGQIDEEDIAVDLENHCSMEPHGNLDHNQSTITIPNNERECLDGSELEKIEECILIRLFPKSPKVGTFALEWDKETLPAFRDCETCVTPKDTFEEECQTSKSCVDASCDVMFVNERKNSGSQTSWLDSMKTIYTAENVQELYGKQSRIDKVTQTVYTIGTLPKQALSKCVEDKVQVNMEEMQTSESRGIIPSTDKLSIVDFVLRGKFSTPCKSTQLQKQNACFCSNASGTQRNDGSETKEQKPCNSSKKNQNNLGLVQSGATVSSYQTSSDWWHAVNSLEKSFLAPSLVGFHGTKPTKNCPEYNACKCPLPGQSDNRVFFQPEKCGLLATESSIEDIRRKVYQVEKSKPKFFSMNKCSRKREDFKDTLPAKIKPFDPCSPPRKVQRKDELSSYSPIRKETPKSKSTTINYPSPARISKDSPMQLYKDSKHQQNCRENFDCDFSQSMGKTGAIILMDDNSDVASITESANTECGSGDASPAKFKVKSNKTKKGVSTVESMIFKKSSSSYDNVTVERVVTQKKKTFKKFI